MTNPKCKKAPKPGLKGNYGAITVMSDEGEAAESTTVMFIDFWLVPLLSTNP